jgi:ABC-2 type transport system ATP-binding protein
MIKIEHLSHRYGSSWAIRDINLDIDDKGIVGLLGSNGAGKSTMMNILCGVLRQTQGNVSINGMDIRKNPQDAKKQIGFLPQNAPLYLDLTVEEYLIYCAELRFIPRTKIRTAVNEAKDRCGVTHFSSRLIGNLSGGYRQRVGIAQAIIHHPKVVVLDEPTNGLDPNQIIEVRTLIREIAQERLVIFSSHILSEVQLLCRDIKMIESGRIVFSDTMDAFNNYLEADSILLYMENPPVETELLKIPGITGAKFLSDRHVRIHFKGEREIAEKLIAASMQNGWRLQEINFEKSSIDEIFKQLSVKSTN